MKNTFEIEVVAVDTSDKGHAICRDDLGRVFFVEGLIPNDRALVHVWGKKKGHFYANIVSVLQYSEYRDTPFCPHFGVCGGCKWQHMSYKAQLQFKEKKVLDAMKRIGHLSINTFLPIKEAPAQRYYRNKMEYTFSNKRWLTQLEMEGQSPVLDTNALGFHRPGSFDKVVDIQSCYLQENKANQIRNALGDYCRRERLSFFDLKHQKGLMRNLIIRKTSLGQWMACVIFGENDPQGIEKVMNFLQESFPDIQSLVYSINLKKNDSLFGLKFILHKGEQYIVEQLGNVKYRISPGSFFQTNSEQAKALFDIVVNFLELKGSETLYDLYCGAGSIGLYLADSTDKVIGIEELQTAIDDARANAALNGISNAFFYTGDVGSLFDEELIKKHGHADAIIVDPPRAGLHTHVVKSLLMTEAQKIVYVSCNPSTQARDLALLVEKYDIVKMQPVDMFPQTSHVENVALLHKKTIAHR